MVVVKEAGTPDACELARQHTQVARSHMLLEIETHSHYDGDDGNLHNHEVALAQVMQLS